MLMIGIGVGLLAYAAWIAAACFFQVDEGHLAVLSRFGAAVRAPGKHELATFGPGLHFKWPWLKVHLVSMKEQLQSLTEGHPMAMANDGTVLWLDASLRFRPVAANLEKYLFDLERPRELFTHLARSLLRNEIANFGAEKSDVECSYALIRRERRALNGRIETACRQALSEGYGVEFSAVDLADVKPPEEVGDALNAMVHAAQEADAAYADAEAINQRRVVAAEQGVEVAKANARAAEAEIEKLGEHLGALADARTLSQYVARRKAEVLAQTRTLFVRT
jgi:regulator of protease activity HflC (stomatin/prohibitin superfamily)